MDVDITPDPTPEEREAIVRALERLLAHGPNELPAAYRSAWRNAGLRENVERD